MKTFLKFGLAAVSATFLALGATSSAFAADINVGPSDVAGFENGTAGDAGFNYTQWHVGNYSDPAKPVSDSLAFSACGVKLLPAESAESFVQVLLGFETRPTTANAMNTDELAALFSSISIDVAQGDVTIQVPTFGYHSGDPEQFEFNTFRNQTLLGPGVHTFTGLSLSSSNNWFGDDLTSDELLETMQSFVTDSGDIFEILGVGFNGSADAIVNSISFGGNTYYFGTGNCAPLSPTAPASVQTAAQ